MPTKSWLSIDYYVVHQWRRPKAGIHEEEQNSIVI
jgi:hypothetical protein